VVELAYFDGETNKTGGRRDTPGREAGEEEGDRQVGGQGPEHIPGVVFDCRRKGRRVGPRGEAQQDDG
jgi:hypothetical protein